MKKRVAFMIVASFLVTFLLTLGVLEANKSHVKEAREVSVMVLSPNGDSGSGVLTVNDGVVFVWTDAHVIDSLQKSRTILDPHTGQSRVEVTYDDAWIVQEEHQDGRKVGETKYLAQVVRFSKDEDIALLRLYKKGWTGRGARFIKPDVVPEPGEALWHVGSMHGAHGHNTLSDGVFSTAGRLRWQYNPNDTRGIIYDQVTITALGGSSGGGLFRKSSGQCIGLLTEYISEYAHGCFCITPARRLWAFANRTDCEWAMTQNVPVPCDEVIFATPITDKELPPPPVRKPLPPGIRELVDLLPR